MTRRDEEAVPEARRRRYKPALDIAFFSQGDLYRHNPYLPVAPRVIPYHCHPAVTYLKRAFSRTLPWFLGSCLAIVIIGASTGILLPLFMFIGHTLLRPLAPLLAFLGAAEGDATLAPLVSLSWYAFLAMGLALAGYVFVENLQPTHLLIGRMTLKTGPERSPYIALLRHVGGSTYSVIRAIAISDIVRVRLERPRGRRNSTDFLALLENNRGDALGFRFGSILEPELRGEVLDYLIEGLPEELHPEFDVLIPTVERQSYTELWLQELAAPPQRGRLLPLDDGMTLQKGAYTVLSHFAWGGQGTLYEAFCGDDLERVVVLKEFILPIFPDSRMRKQTAERFQREAAVLSRLDHPQIVKFHDMFIEDHRLYIVLDKVHGIDLRELCRRRGGTLCEEVVSDIATQVCSILEYLHSHQPPVIHRDISPDNLMVDEATLKVTIIDFSVATELESGITGTVVGKTGYMAPEQFRGEACQQSDLYSLGATMYYLLTGVEPEAIMQSHPRDANKSVSERMDEIVCRATALDVAERFASAGEMADNLVNS